MAYPAISGAPQSGLDALRNVQRDFSERYPQTFSQALDGFNQETQQLYEDATNPIYPSLSPALTLHKPSNSFEYFNADLAKHYEMGRSSAYQEALANTAYQRSVADMKAAGLNPAVMFSSGHGSGASSNVYAGSSRSGRSFRMSRGKLSLEDENLFSGGIYNTIQTIGGLIGMAVSKNPSGFYLGSQTAKGAMSFLDSLYKIEPIGRAVDKVKAWYSKGKEWSSKRWAP